MLNYDRSLVLQETGWWCGPAATQTVLQARGIKIPESQIAAAIEEIENPGRGDDRDGTDYVGLIEQFLDGKVPEARYTSVYMRDDPPTIQQKDALWQNIKRSIDAGWGVVINIVAPPTNPPAATKGSVRPPYPSYLTTFHYAAIMGYDDDPMNRAGWIADSAGFGGITGWWCPFDGRGSICSLIPPKGYCYADVIPKPSPSPVIPPSVPGPSLEQSIAPDKWQKVWRTHLEWRAFTYGDTAAIGELIAAAAAGDNLSRAALVRLEQVNPSALQAFLAKKG